MVLTLRQPDEISGRSGVEDMRGRFLNQLSGGEKLCLDCYESYDRFDVSCHLMDMENQHCTQYGSADSRSSGYTAIFLFSD